MRRLAIVLLFLVAAASVVGVFVIESVWIQRYVGAGGIVAMVAQVYAIRLSVPRKPNLHVEYRNPEAGNRAEIAVDRFDLLVVLVNDGAGVAEGIEVRFDRAGGAIYNEAGNNIDKNEIDATIYPPRFLGRERSLGPRQELVICRLVHRRYPGVSEKEPPAQASWEARSKGMILKKGVVTLVRTPTS